MYNANTPVFSPAQVLQEIRKAGKVDTSSQGTAPRIFDLEKLKIQERSKIRNEILNAYEAENGVNLREKDPALLRKLVRRRLHRWDPNPVQTIQLRDETSSWIQNQRWRYFITLTFDNANSTPLEIRRKVDNLYKLNDEYFIPKNGPNLWGCFKYMEKFREVIEASDYRKWEMFYVVEQHKTGDHHIHCLAKCSKSSKEDIRKLSQAWRAIRGGYTKIHDILGKPKNQKDLITAYCAKYVLKEKSYENWGYEIMNPGHFRTKARKPLPQMILQKRKRIRLRLQLWLN